MFKIVLAFVVAVVVVANASAANIVVKQIVVGPQHAEDVNDFSLSFNFINNGATITNWQFGFYMPRNFRKLSTRNRNLKLRVCETNTKNCVNLSYQQSGFKNPDLSAGSVTVVAPTKKFPLSSGKSYTLNLLHNSSTGPKNYSALPQSLFIITPLQVISLKTTPQNYLITGLKVDALQESNQARISQNWANSTNQMSALAVVPTPQQVVFESSSSAWIKPQQVVAHDLTNSQQAVFWLKQLSKSLNMPLTYDHTLATSGINLVAVSSKQIANPEGYQLEIGQNLITLKASHAAGFFYGIQTLQQLWFASPNALPAITIDDYPRFLYRGVLVDVARHYFTVEQLKNFIDVMSAHKLNTLHLHLADDEAFRINLPAYPQLQEIASTRGLGQLIGPMVLQQANLAKTIESLPSAANTYAGSYSVAELHDLIAYANLRQITIIPEIELPNHARALKKAFVNSFDEEGDSSEYVGFGDNAIPVCLFNNPSIQGQEFTKILTDLSYQVAQIFNGQTTTYAVNNELSIGGDEVYKGTWDKSPSCQVIPWNKMDYLHKEHHFLDLFNNDAKIKQLRLSGWHEFILNHNGLVNQLGIKPAKVGHVWVWGVSNKVMDKARRLANAKYPTVLVYADALYLDMTYNQDPSEPGLYWATQFGDTYAALTSASLASSTGVNSYILGLEAALWTDVIPNYQQLQYMALPKLSGMAEASWSNVSVTANNKPNWRSLATRLGCGQTGFLAYLAKNYAITYRGYPHGIRLEAPMLCK